MTNDGGPAEETTSYGLRPPTPAGPQAPEHAQPSAHDAQVPGARGESEAPGQQAAGPYQATQAAATPETPGVGRVVGGRYKLLARLGHGGMGTVWRAHDQVVDREVAVKEPRVPDHLSQRERETMYQRMRREARTAARLDHPSVVTIHDVVDEDEQPWIVMELVQGRSLADVLREGTVGAREAARIGSAIAGALDAAHAKGILHRDVKPDNVLLGNHERVVLTDFGIAQVEGEQSLTETGAFVGSPEFIAPERVLGQRPGPESDLWSLGVVLYAATEGVSPFRRTNTPATLQAVLSVEPPRAAQAASSSGALGMLLAGLLQKEPGQRPGAAEIRQTLADVARPKPQLPTYAGTSQSSRLTRTLRAYPGKVRSSRRWQWGTGGAVLALLAVVGLVVFFTLDRAPSGWSTRDEDKRVRATLAVPDDYKRSATENSVTFTDPKGFIEIYLARYTKNVHHNALAEANARKAYYEDGAEKNYSDTMEDIRAEANEAEQQGKEAATLVTTFTDKEADDDAGIGETPPVALSKRRAQELYYINADGVAWKLMVEMPKNGSLMEKGEQVFDDVRGSLEIHEL